jgi:nicotinate phosphoribosyltransferase
MGSRRTHEQAAVAAARAAWVAGFTTTSNVEAGRSFGIPTAGTSAHAFTLLHDSEVDAFAAQVASLGPGTTLLVDTYDTEQGIANALAAAGTELGAVRLDSGDLAALAHRARQVLDAAGAVATRIVATSDLDEYAIAGLADAPIDIYGVGTSVVTGSGHPAAGLVFKLVEVEGRPVAKSAAGGKTSAGGRKVALRRRGSDGVAVAEVIQVLGPTPGAPGPALGTGAAPGVGTQGDQDASQWAGDAAGDRPLVVPLARAGRKVHDGMLAEARSRHEASVRELPESGRALRATGPAIPTIRS